MAHSEIKTFTSREFARNLSAAKRGASEGNHIIITNRGKPAFVLLSIDEYRRLTKTGMNLEELPRMPDV